MIVEPARPANLRRISTTSGAPASASGAGSATNLCAGMRVEHVKFGTGVVLGVEPSAMDTKVTVRFDDPAIGKKSLLSKFAKLKVLA